MQQKSALRRLTAFWTILLLIPALFYSIRDGTQFERKAGDIRPVSSAAMHFTRFAQLACPEEFLPSRGTQQLSQYRNGKKIQTTGLTPLFFAQIQCCFFLVCILFRILWLFGRSVTDSHRCIIRYIHDQDGRKGETSAF